MQFGIWKNDFKRQKTSQSLMSSFMGEGGGGEKKEREEKEHNFIMSKRKIWVE